MALQPTWYSSSSNCTRRHMKRSTVNAGKDLKAIILIIYQPSALSVLSFSGNVCFWEISPLQSDRRPWKLPDASPRLVTITSVWSPEGYYFCGWRVVGWLIVQSSYTGIRDEKQRPDNRFNTGTFWYSEVYNLHWNREHYLLLNQRLELSQCQGTKPQQ